MATTDVDSQELRREFRMMIADLEARRYKKKKDRDGEEEEVEELRLEGYASTFDEKYEVWDFDEVVRKGAFKRTLREDDIRALWNHRSDIVLGRNKAGTLDLSEDSKGLRVRIHLPDTQQARDLYTSVERGDVDQMSFGFQCREEKWKKAEKKGERPLRELLDVRMLEVSPVTFPANDGTSIAARGECPAEVRSAYEENRWEDPEAPEGPPAPPEQPPGPEDRADLDALEARMEALG